MNKKVIFKPELLAFIQSAVDLANHVDKDISVDLISAETVRALVAFKEAHNSLDNALDAANGVN